MVCLGLEPRAAGWKVQTNRMAAPLAYIHLGHTKFNTFVLWSIL